MIGYVTWAALAAGFFVMGFKGFSAQGIPWSSTKMITGRPARVIGTVCLTLGMCFLILFLAVLYFGLKRARMHPVDDVSVDAPADGSLVDVPLDNQQLKQMFAITFPQGWEETKPNRDVTVERPHDN